ncbi:glucoamylase family protein [Persicobacter psychrovividus]|uniref:Glycoamylase-like domain-containing protein n=1 Tax=Persicobacter psychrovividus TaxID=387638 RepID=A0ABM7VI65_9BACT|nr:hypothetical protein PEPS_29390 [Persicobacter psychrovividus]
MKKALLILFTFIFSQAFAQDAYFFRNSKNAEYYDTGLAFPTAPSLLKQVNGDKLPVTSAVAVEGNALELSYTSMPNGQWKAVIITPGWGFQDLSVKKEITFMLRSEVALAANDLPDFSLEAQTGANVTAKQPLANYIKDLPAQQWVKVTIPLEALRKDAANANIDFQKIKGFNFEQGGTDGKPHTLYVDNITATGAQGVDPNQPLPELNNLKIKGYDSHIEITFDAPSATGYQAALYHINRQKDTVEVATTNLNHFMDFVGQDTTVQYAVRWLQNGRKSPYQLLKASTKTMTDQQLVEMVQEHTFRFFWDGAFATGVTAERRTVGQDPGNIVATGGSGWGFMAVPVGVKHQWISRAEGAQRVLNMLNFFRGAERFHGAWAHWIDINTGKAIPFSEKDNGADIVETALLAQGMIATSSYFDGSNATETMIRSRVKELLNTIEWKWFLNKGNSIFWHWSPDYGFAMNHTVHGFNEAMIVYVLAAAGEHGVGKVPYDKGWAMDGKMRNGQTFYNFKLPLGYDMGGSLFLSQYSFMVVDPNGLSDQYAKYDEQVINQTKINHAYCVANTSKGYSNLIWGLTASDIPGGYFASEPSSSGANDDGTIAPTAALGAMAYTPELSLPTLKKFYRELGPKIFKWYGFRDAFNTHKDWVAAGYLAIDEGPILVMLENYSSGLLWKLGMTSPYIQSGLKRLNIAWNKEKYDVITAATKPVERMTDARVFVNQNQQLLRIFTKEPIKRASVRAISMLGQSYALANLQQYNTYSTVRLGHLAAGIYFLQFETQDGKHANVKFMLK